MESQPVEIAIVTRSISFIVKYLILFLVYFESIQLIK